MSDAITPNSLEPYSTDALAEEFARRLCQGEFARESLARALAVTMLADSYPRAVEASREAVEAGELPGTAGDLESATREGAEQWWTELMRADFEEALYKAIRELPIPKGR